MDPSRNYPVHPPQFTDAKLKAQRSSDGAKLEPEPRGSVVLHQGACHWAFSFVSM